ncbi:molybdenum ABC transporter ATP-binding protein [Phyllobacterium sp. 0TCS1.6C]|uniref:molybdenum ABC transporter ATP-binding protein n=1 Tax=unclassified Phyllobacterium TaxID=2638441 RepID=UPI0022647E9C|nr:MULTISPECIES: molybdenum ABC transporter ATP-binding protein [unclassified Phyllobacterium]MCX8282593.1 molybdenum ABC transporter ATP-binding protein [Phyllobacterium sp. 0TCS1.6C]MCX8292475.1 molybdenum ABC transporter ATP-binding protein [Phyllobacterium sp. 0TCS1.6A]
MTLSFQAKQRLGVFELDAEFTAGPGVTALFGRSGSGKTSIIRLLAGLSRPAKGHILFDGDVLLDTEKGVFVPKHRRGFGYVFQDGRLFPHLTVEKNLRYGMWFAASQRKSTQFSQIVDLLGIDGLLQRRPANLSGGEKQRVAIGRALLAAPRLLLLDEPLSALDDPRKAEILPYLQALRDEMRIPIIYVTHAMAEIARLADRVIVLRDGKVGMSGDVDMLLNHPETVVEMDEGRDAGAFVEGMIADHDDRYGLTTVMLGSQRLFVAGTFPAETRMARFHISARDVMLATRHPEEISALNILEGRVEGLRPTVPGVVDVQVNCGGVLIISRLTQLSCENLALSPGKDVFAIIKSVSFAPL